MLASVTFPASEAARLDLLCGISWEFLRLHGAGVIEAAAVETFLKPSAETLTVSGSVECVALEPRGTGLGLRLPPGEGGTLLPIGGLPATPVP